MSNCSVQGCFSIKRKKGWNPSFHQFPSDESTCAKWVGFCENPSLVGKTAKELSKRVVCGLHFPAPHKNINGNRTLLISKQVVPMLKGSPRIIKIVRPNMKLEVTPSNPRILQGNVVSLEGNRDGGVGNLPTEQENTLQLELLKVGGVPKQSPQTFIKKTKSVNGIPRIFFNDTQSVQRRVIQVDKATNTGEGDVIAETSTVLSDSDNIPDDEIDCLPKLSKELVQTTRAAADNTTRRRRMKNIKGNPVLVYNELLRQRSMNRKLRVTCTQLRNKCIAERAARKTYLKHMKKHIAKEQYDRFITQLKKDNKPLHQPRKRKRVVAQPSQKLLNAVPAMQQLSVSSVATAKPGVIQVPNTLGQPGQLVRLVVFNGAQQCFPFNFDALKKAS